MFNRCIKYLLAVGTIGLIMSACSSRYPVMFDSNPKGASLVCDGKNWGYTPMWLYYDEIVREYSTLDVSSCSANWISGYSENYPSDMRIFPEGGTTVTVNRPYGDGYEKDAQFALQVQQMKIQERQAEAAEKAATAAQQNNYLNQQRNYQRNGQQQIDQFYNMYYNYKRYRD